MNDAFMLSVRLMTFNHEPFIREAMDGIMMQESNFKIEVVVGDDFSTDNTLKIIRQYKNTENITIKILEREKNDGYWNKRQKLGRLYNFTNILENCSGKYIALLDGDDYWTDPLKLQKQVDILEQSPDCIACHHWQKIAVQNEDGSFSEKDAPTEGHGYFPQNISTVKSIFENKLRVKTRTVVFRIFLNKILCFRGGILV